MLILHKNNNINGLMDADAIIIGAGACGLMCAVQAGYLGKKVILLEKNDKPGAKILISGGGRCNYTNLFSSDENFISSNKDFLKSAFQQWSVANTIAFFDTYGIQGQEKTLGQLFPIDKSAKDVVEVFTTLCTDLDQQIITNAEVSEVLSSNEGFNVQFQKNGKQRILKSPKLVIATGGLPIPKMGATDFAMRFARKYNLNIIETAPGLVPLTITGKDEEWYAQLSGNTVFCEVSNERISFEENILFTHWGLSGPAILQISSYWQRGEVFNLNLLPRENISELIEQERSSNGKTLLSALFNRFFSKKLTDAMSKYLPIEKTVASMTKLEIELVYKTIHLFTVKAAGDKGYDKAEVMRGGIDTKELSSKTLECRKIPGLFFGGECVDVTGWLGGYNFQWAWAAGYVIAQNI
ncbi:NAD(P)/FAD-dependent oxidoreductase [Pedobacter sp. JCM 36344]|uniref:NAD(P)/FAD-dependent oxidoreductase n=1 Tax=Pedobacter sp. JCM 36344 TaxID=3374280 RepID=UPI00397841D3